jgi:hypothetical protein
MALSLSSSSSQLRLNLSISVSVSSRRSVSEEEVGRRKRRKEGRGGAEEEEGLRKRREGRRGGKEEEEGKEELSLACPFQSHVVPLPSSLLCPLCLSALSVSSFSPTLRLVAIDIAVDTLLILNSILLLELQLCCRASPVRG